MEKIISNLDIGGQVCIVTGGGGLLGYQHARAILEGNGIPVLIDISEEGLDNNIRKLRIEYCTMPMLSYVADITQKESLLEIRDSLLKKYNRIDVLINNASNNPKVEKESSNFMSSSFYDFSETLWNDDLKIGLTGALLCCQVFGEQMETAGKGVILNISSDYGIISPDQRVYKYKNEPESKQMIKPISYSVVKHGIIGMTKYLATYWAQKGIRVNTLCPASIHNNQNDEFIQNISNLIPMGRMSEPEEYLCTILYLISDAAPYMTGATVVLDGGRTIW